MEKKVNKPALNGLTKEEIKKLKAEKMKLKNQNQIVYK